jgi:hypothetical protein
VTEALRRGYSATSGAVEPGYRRRTTAQQQIHLTITVSDHHFYLGIDGDWRSGHPNEQERRRRDRVVGPVRLQVINGHEHRTSIWTLDATNERVAVVLAQALQELELRSEVAEGYLQERLADARKRRQRWDNAVAQARERYFEDQRPKALIKQVDQWHLAQRINAYLAALEEALPECESPEELTAWIEWSRAYRQRIDPLQAGVRLPADHEPTPEKLAPYLPSGLSPYTIR